MEQQNVEEFRVFFEDEDPDNIRSHLETGDPFFFQFRGQDYNIEGFFNQDGTGPGFYIRKPLYTYDESRKGLCYDTEYPGSAYPGVLEAKTPEEFMRLPFLDGKTLFERFDELKFFEV
jgi:hypothetical protein